MKNHTDVLIFHSAICFRSEMGIYMNMRERVSNLESDDSVIGSSNFGKFIAFFESDDTDWIERINDKLEYEQAELEVVQTNEKAIYLYKKLGFQTYGTFPDNMKYADGTYVDALWMMKKL